jgi:hypothetical protein
MGAFNILVAETDCPNCEKLAKFEAQFKYGDTWQLVRLFSFVSCSLFSASV